MRQLRALWIRARGIVGSAHASDDIAAELESHIQMHIDDNLRAGMAPEEARRQALLRLGGLDQTRQACRERKTLPLLENFVQDVRYAARQLRKSPGFTAVVVITLALGIGLNSALFSIIDTVLLHPIPWPHASELVCVDASKPNFETGSISYLNFRDWQRENHSLSALAIFRATSFTLTGSGNAEQIRGDYLSSDFFSLLGVKPVLGRLFAPGEDEIGRGPIALISAGMWARKFGARPDVIGKTLNLDGRAYAIVGVVPNFDLSFSNFQAGEVYIPLGQWQTKALSDRGAGLGIHGIARLRPGVTLAEAQADLGTISAHLATAFPEDDNGVVAHLTPLRSTLVGKVQPLLLVLLGAVGFVLLIACVNVANLLLARSTARAQEFAVRLALGASRTRILRQLLTESTLLGLAGGALGLSLAAWGTGAAIKLAPAALPRASAIHLSPLVLCFTVVISLGVGIFFGLLPAWRIAGQQPQSTLREGGRGGSGVRHRAQDSLVIFEMAAALVLLAGAGLMIRSLLTLSQTDPGFQPQGILTFSLSVPYSPATATPEGTRAYLREVDRQIMRVPGIQDVSFMWGGSFPMSGGDDEQLFWLENEPRPASASDMHWALRYEVEPDYLQLMRIPLLRGRFFEEGDRENTPPVVVIDEDLAHQYFAGIDPIGKHINLDGSDEKATVVGVVRHVMHWELDNDAAFPLHAQIYKAFAQVPGRQLVSTTGIGADIGVRTSHPETAFARIQAALRQMNQEQVVYDPITMNQMIASTLSARRFSMILLGIFAGLSLLLAGVGLYGVISYLVGQRTQEMAIRMALGANRRSVLAWVLRRGARLAIAGTGAGILAALILTRVMASASMLYGVRSWDPLTLAGVVTILMVIALAACYFPARRAASVNPMQALRLE